MDLTKSKGNSIFFRRYCYSAEPVWRASMADWQSFRATCGVLQACLSGDKIGAVIALVGPERQMAGRLLPNGGG